jgi:translation initiation factor IF-2
MTVQELAEILVVQDTEIVKVLFQKGIAVNITQNLDIPTITMVAKELGVEVETAEPEAEARKVTEMVEAEDLNTSSAVRQ